MEEKSQGGRKSDYERNMETLGYEALRKAKKRAIIWTIVFVAITGFGTITGQLPIIGVGGVLTIIGLVLIAKRSSKLKDDMEVRKAGLAEYKKRHGNAPSESSSPTYSPEESAPRTSRPAITSNSESRSASNVNTFSFKGNGQSSSSGRQSRSEENVDTSVYGPIKGF